MGKDYRKEEIFIVRKIAIYLPKRLTGLTNKEIGGVVFKTMYSAVSKSVRDMERTMKKEAKIRKDI